MSHTFWVLTIIYAVCFAMCLISVYVSTTDHPHDRREYLGSVIAGGALIYLIAAFLGIMG